MTEKEKLVQAQKVLSKLLEEFTPLVSITLGSGLGYMVEEMLEDSHSCPYSKIPNCPIPGATGHQGQLWWGKLSGVPVIMEQGRVHLFEGRPVHEVVFLTRLMIMMGVKTLIHTHATGALTRNLEPGDIVSVWSQIPADCPDPTSGPGIPELGCEFSPVDTVFDPKLLKIAKLCALEEMVALHRGVSHFKFGRTYEGWADGNAMARAGADVATMSTVPNNMAAAQMGGKVLDLALVTDMVENVRPTTATVVSHEEVLAVSETMKEPFCRLIMAIVEKISNQSS